MKLNTLSSNLFFFLIIYRFYIWLNNNSAKVKTIQNIKDAIIGETTASTKYAAYAKKAREEGYNNIALLFEAASKSESIHAGNHLAVLKQLGENIDNFSPKFEVKQLKKIYRML